MRMTRTLTVALLSAALTSCATPQGVKQPENKTELTEPRVVTKTEYLPGEVVIQPYPTPDSSITPDVKPLTEKFIPDGPDIEGKGAIATATAWSEQYHNLATTYNVLRGWVIGVKAGQQGIDAPPVLPPPTAAERD